jgi:hypothetical protein
MQIPSSVTYYIGGKEIWIEVNRLRKHFAGIFFSLHTCRRDFLCYTNNTLDF